MIKTEHGINQMLGKMLEKFGYVMNLTYDLEATEKAGQSKYRITINEVIGPRSTIVCWSFTDLNQAMAKVKEIMS